MRVKVQSRHIEGLTPALENYVNNKLVARLDPLCQAAATTVEIELGDGGHARTGANKQCRVLVLLPRGKPVVIHEIDANLYEAIDRAENRVLIHVKRELARRGNQHRRRLDKRRERAEVTKGQLTCPKEAWELEVAEYERGGASLSP